VCGARNSGFTVAKKRFPPNSGGREKSMKAMLLVLTLASLFTPACIFSSSQIVTINTDKDVKILYVDGKEAGFGINSVNVKPGHHQIVPCFYVSYECLLGATLEIDVQAGHTYTIKHKWEKKEDFLHTDKATFWVEENK
jgi:hypothetical protein